MIKDHWQWTSIDFAIYNWKKKNFKIHQYKNIFDGKKRIISTIEFFPTNIYFFRRKADEEYNFKKKEEK